MAGSPTYDFLGNSFLLDPRRFESRYRDVPPDELEAELSAYREHIDAELSELEVGDDTHSGHSRLIAGSGDLNLQLVSQCAWYVSEFVIRDPLYELSAPVSNAQRPFEKMLGLEEGDAAARREEIFETVRQLKEITPMVAAGYVRLLPTSRLFEPPEQLPITMPRDGGADLLPAPLMQWFRERVSVKRVELKDGKMLVFDAPGGLEPRRSIAVQFNPVSTDPFASTDGSQGADPIFPYNLMEQRVVDFDEVTGKFSAFLHLPDTAPEPEYFKAWVRQSIHTSAFEVVRRTATEIRLANRFNARYLTLSPFTANLLGATTSESSRTDVVAQTVNAIVDLDVPFLPEASVSDIMRVRQDEGEAFQAFRDALEAQLRELELEEDPERARIKAEHVRHELATIQLAAVERQVKKFRRKFVTDSVLAVGTLAAALPTGGLSLLGTGIAGASIYKAKAEYDQGVKTHPAYFLWRVRRLAKRRG
jgi:hypothetical protein